MIIDMERTGKEIEDALLEYQNFEEKKHISTVQYNLLVKSSLEYSQSVVTFAQDTAKFLNSGIE
jgi:hypothetical protein